MPKGRAPTGGASIFASLPTNIKQHLRAQINQIGPGASTSSTPVPKFLPTQPAAAGEKDEGEEEEEEEEDDEEKEEEDVNGDPDRLRVQEGSPGLKRAAASTEAATTISAKKRKLAPLKTAEPKRLLQSKRSAELRWDCSGLVPRYSSFDEVPAEIQKYYTQRDFLFRDFDSHNILLDETGWFSVTPESVAAHIAERCRADTVIDAFAGVGGNVIQLAMTCERVIAIDNDITRLRLARHNAMQYGVADRVEWICADFVEFAEAYERRIRLKDRAKELGPVDVVFLSPPWGGVDYKEGAALNRTGPSKEASVVFALTKLKPVSAQALFRLSTAFSPNIAFYLPKNVDLMEVSRLAPHLEDGSEQREMVEVEEEHVGRADRGSKVKALTVYFGGLVA